MMRVMKRVIVNSINDEGNDVNSFKDKNKSDDDRVISFVGDSEII